MPTLQASYESEGASIAAGATATLTIASFLPGMNELILIKLSTGDKGATVSTPVLTNGLTVVNRIARNTAASTTGEYIWTAQQQSFSLMTPGATTVSVNVKNNLGSASRAHLVVERWSGTYLTSTQMATGLTAAGAVSSSTAAVTVTVNQGTPASSLSWVFGDWNGRTITGQTAASGNVVNQTISVSGLLAAVSGYMNTTGTTTATRTIGCSALTSSSSGARSVMIVVQELPVADPPMMTTALGSIMDDFSTSSSQWTLNGAGVANGRGYVNCSHNNGTPNYSSRKYAMNVTFANSSMYFEVESMPGFPGDAANAQFWVMDPATAGVRMGFEYRAAANMLDCVEQTTNYATVAGTVSVPFNPTTIRWLQLAHTGSQIIWSASSDGLAWTTLRTLSTLPSWVSKNTLNVSIEAFRTAGVNDTLLIDSFNIAPSVTPTVMPTGSDALQTRTLNELVSWKNWLTANNARGFIGEFGWVTLYSDAANFNAVADKYLTAAEVHSIDTSVWASGREWGNGYPLGIHVGTAVGDPLTIANGAASGASSIVGSHRTRNNRWHGVGLAGHERGIGTSGGTGVRTNTPLIHTAADFDFMAANGIDFVRLAVAWERLQPTLGGALDTAGMSTLNDMIRAASTAGIRLVIDLHNYGRYTNADGSVVALGGATLTDTLFSDFWTKFSTWVQADATRNLFVIGYGIMNEPHDLPGGAASWERASQAAVAAIRANNDTHFLLVAGHAWSSLTNWRYSHPSGWITDTNFAYEAHHYWDTQSALGKRSGTYQQSSTGPILTYSQENTAASSPQEPDWIVDDSVTGFVTWAENYNASTAVTGGYADAPYNRQTAAGDNAASGLPWPPPIFPTPFGRAGRALQTRLPDSGKRFEVTPNLPNSLDGDWFYTGFAFCYEPDMDTTGSGFQTIWQLRPDDTSGSPPVSLEIQRSQLCITGGYGRPGGATQTTYQLSKQNLLTLQPYRWYNVVLFVGVWSAPNSGRFDVWVDGVRYAVPNPIKPGTNYPGTGTGTYEKCGLYKDTNIVRGATVWTTDHKRGNGYKSVDPTRPQYNPRPMPRLTSL